MFTYSEKAIDHFRNPRNIGRLNDFDGAGQIGSPACGQMLRLTFKLDLAGRIDESRFQAFGCPGSIASASALTELIKGKTLDEAEKITFEEIDDYLAGLPHERAFCGDLTLEVLKDAIADYRTTGDRDAPDHQPMIDCRQMPCPLNYVKIKLLLDDMSPGQRLCALLNREGIRNAPPSAEADGHRIIEQSRCEDHWKVIVEKG